MVHNPQNLSTANFWNNHVLYVDGATYTALANQGIAIMGAAGRAGLAKDSIILINSVNTFNQLGDDMWEIMNPGGIAPPSNADNGISRHGYQVLVRTGQGPGSTDVITTSVRLGFRQGRINHLDEDGF